MERIKDTLQEVVRNLLAKKGGLNDASMEARLKKALTKKELGHIKFHYFRKGTLGLIVDSSAWLYALNLKKENLLNKLKGTAPQIKEVRFSIGDIK